MKASLVGENENYSNDMIRKKREDGSSNPVLSGLGRGTCWIRIEAPANARGPCLVRMVNSCD